MLDGQDTCVINRLKSVMMGGMDITVSTTVVDTVWVIILVIKRQVSVT